ncbi:hypothetical protein ROD_03741 [Citrobacter rodentium ICC168]|uniref:Uncharacterized protein n=1 Tax=Citrobacter rodentium (strain ICC168) TaxID=637910 RepID=D2TK26_CITRI|nr:hypothetical protein ROD_03741 [Citrobacter rodentium ICC168]
MLVNAQVISFVTSGLSPQQLSTFTGASSKFSLSNVIQAAANAS